MDTVCFYLIENLSEVQQLFNTHNSTSLIEHHHSHPRSEASPSPIGRRGIPAPTSCRFTLRSCAILCVSNTDLSNRCNLLLLATTLEQYSMTGSTLLATLAAYPHGSWLRMYPAFCWSYS